MKCTITFEPINTNHTNAAAELILSAYQEERKVLPYLPDEPEYLSYFQKKIGNLFAKGKGIAALCDDQLVGFLAGFERDELWGNCKGIYSPLYGHGVIKEHRHRLYQELYQRAADVWVSNSCTNHALTFFAHEQETIHTWFWLGFGLRCVDAIREVKPIQANNPAIHIRKTGLSDIPALAEIERGLHLHLRKSPMFMPIMEEDPIQHLTEWLSQPQHHMWVAYHDGKPLGYMRIEPIGETFVSEHASVMNITGAYVEDHERKSGVGVMLLGEIQQWLLQNGYPLCGVDFESFNPAGSNFWTKYFTPYTYSMVRRIDERIIAK
jgi:GNAT superfamily N-acetyltransferase